jgi:DNA-binding transcriptional LysR family regulator
MSLSLSATVLPRRLFARVAMSAHIKALESELGVPLFDRVGRNSVVNHAGQVLYQKAERLFSVADELKAAMNDLRGASMGRLSLGVSIAWEYHLPRAISMFKHEYPHVDLSTTVANSDRIERLALDRAIDIGFIGRPTPRSELVSEQLAADELMAVCGPKHTLAMAGDLSPGRLGGEAFVVRESGSAMRVATDDSLHRLGLDGYDSTELGSQEAIKQVVMSGWGIGIVSRQGSESEIRAGLLVALRVTNMVAPMPLYMVCHREKALTRTYAAFVDMLAADSASRSRPKMAANGVASRE